jgi:hypothetical protein
VIRQSKYEEGVVLTKRQLSIFALYIFWLRGFVEAKYIVRTEPHRASVELLSEYG